MSLTGVKFKLTLITNHQPLATQETAQNGHASSPTEGRSRAQHNSAVRHRVSTGGGASGAATVGTACIDGAGFSLRHVGPPNPTRGFCQNQEGLWGPPCKAPCQPASVCPGEGLGSELRRQRRPEGFSHLPEPSTRPGGHAVGPASSLPHPRGWLCSRLHAWTWSERPERGLLARKQTACRAAQRPTFPRGSWGARQVPVRTEEGWGKPPSSSRLLSQSGSCPARELDPEQRHLSGWGRKAGRGRDGRTKDQGTASRGSAPAGPGQRAGRRLGAIPWSQANLDG